MARYMIAKCKESDKLYVGPIGTENKHTEIKIKKLEEYIGEEMEIMSIHSLSPFLFQELSDIIKTVVFPSYNLEDNWWKHTQYVYELVTGLLYNVRRKDQIEDLRTNARVLQTYPKKHPYRKIAERTIIRTANFRGMMRKKKKEEYKARNLENTKKKSKF